MLKIVLHDRADWREQFLPLVFTRPVGDLRIGILTVREKWQRIFNSEVYFYTKNYLQERFLEPPCCDEYLVIAANVCPTRSLVKALVNLPEETVLEREGRWIAYRPSQPTDEPYRFTKHRIAFQDDFIELQQPEDIFLRNADQIVFDYSLITDNVLSMALHSSNIVIGEQPFVGKNVEAYGSTFNTKGGPIFIGNDVIIEQGCHIKGPAAICSGARVKIGAKIYPNVTIGPASTISGEINNTVIWGNSAKGHDGYLGCSVVGECCNIGAGTNNSNLQNNWGEVSVYDYKLNRFRKTGLAKIGVIIGDYAMCGINSSITTGTVIGVGAQIAKSNFIPKFVPDFIWLTDLKNEEYDIEKFNLMLTNRAKLRKENVDASDVRILRDIYRLTKETRKEFITK